MDKAGLARAIREKAGVVDVADETSDDFRDAAELIRVLARIVEGKDLARGRPTSRVTSWP